MAYVDWPMPFVVGLCLFLDKYMPWLILPLVSLR